MTSDLNTTARGLRPASQPIRNMVLVGRTGNGKSSTGNSLLGERVFKTKLQAAGVTLRCEMRSAAIKDGPIINVIDTPGLFDYSVDLEHISREIIKCFYLTEEGLHAVLFVLSTRQRMSGEEESAITALQVLFGSQIFDYMIVVFTGGDELKENEITLDNYLSNCPEFLKAILRICGGRKVLFNNKTKDEGEKVKQVQELLAHVETIYKNTDGIPFTSADDLQHVKEETDKFREQEREIESKNLAEADLAAMMKKLHMEREHTIGLIQHAVENALKQSTATHEREMRELKETLQQSNQCQQLECNIM